MISMLNPSPTALVNFQSSLGEVMTGVQNLNLQSVLDMTDLQNGSIINLNDLRHCDEVLRDLVTSAGKNLFLEPVSKASLSSDDTRCAQFECTEINEANVGPVYVNSDGKNANISFVNFKIEQLKRLALFLTAKADFLSSHLEFLDKNKHFLVNDQEQVKKIIANLDLGSKYFVWSSNWKELANDVGYFIGWLTYQERVLLSDAKELKMRAYKM